VAGKKLKAKSGWNDNGNGTDDYGFSALPGGGCRYICNIIGYTPEFVGIGMKGNWLTATFDSSKPFVRMHKDSNNVFYNFLYIQSLSVRCIEASDGVNGIDGNKK
jgi:uncharacterized protein (TIGR02145 family)